MICVPPTNHEDYLGVGPRDLIHSLAATLLQAWQLGYSLYSSRQVDYPRPVVPSPPGVVELSSGEDDEWNAGQNSLP